MKTLLTYFHGMTLATAILTGAFTLGVLNGTVKQEQPTVDFVAAIQKGR